MDRHAVLAALHRISTGLELTGASPFRVRSYQKAARALGKLPDLVTRAAEGTLQDVPGVGPAVGRVVAQVLAGQVPDALQAIEREIPPGLIDLCTLPGLGPARVRLLHEALGVAGLADLEYACRENRLLDLKGFGRKTQATLITAIETRDRDASQLRRDRAYALAAPFVEALGSVGQVEIVGALRRGMPLVAQVELLVCTPDPSDAPGPRDEPSSDPRVVVHVCTTQARGSALVRHTSSPGHWDALLARAADRGVSLEGHATEAALYEALDLHPTPVERREEDTPLVPRAAPAPRLVRRTDLAGALHNHTTASDGLDSLLGMREAAAARGLTYLGISEHSQSARYARGLDGPALRAQMTEIAALAGDGHACTLLSGVEADILANGALDGEDEVLAQLEVVVASVHRRHGQDAATFTARMVAAARHPRTAIIGHPTGRLLLGRPPAPLDVEALLDACVETGCAVELNANPARLDLDATHLAMARERGVRVSIAADAHSGSALDHLDHGIAIARRGGLRPEDVLNALPLDALREWLHARAQRANGGPQFGAGC